jgi:hypothetical protein
VVEARPQRRREESMFWTVVNTVVVVGTLVVLSWILYSPKRQKSARYQATVVPLANIMDVGFMAMTPLIVVLLGADSPLFMFLLVLAAVLMGGVMGYNIRYYEPLIGKPDWLNRVGGLSKWALIAASVVNIAYYLQLMAALVLAPFEVRNPTLVTAIAVGLLALIGAIGYFAGLSRLDALGQKTTAFNIATVGAVLAGFLAFNFQMLVTGQWVLPDYNPPADPDRLRKLVGFFAIVQGFEASRYLGARYGANLRIRTMRRAQLISGVVFVLLIAASLMLFVKGKPEMKPIAIILIGALVTPFLPWLILFSAIGSQLSAGVNAVSSRSDLMIEATHGKVPRKYTYPLLVVPCIAIVLVTDVTDALAVASRVFAGYYALQCAIAIVLAGRRKQWGRAALFTGVGLLMVIIAVFGMSV